MLLELRNTPVKSLKESPAEILMGRNLRSWLPQPLERLQGVHDHTIRSELARRQAKLKSSYDRTAHHLIPLNIGDSVIV